jgi:hypothetical protein
MPWPYSVRRRRASAGIQPRREEFGGGHRSVGLRLPTAGVGSAAAGSATPSAARGASGGPSSIECRAIRAAAMQTRAPNRETSSWDRRLLPHAQHMDVYSRCEWLQRERSAKPGGSPKCREAATFRGRGLILTLSAQQRLLKPAQFALEGGQFVVDRPGAGIVVLEAGV